VDRATGIDRSGGYATDASGAKPGRSRAPTLGFAGVGALNVSETGNIVAPRWPAAN